ncbi:MAG: DUF2306 domain-containing protein [Chloroflexota bacterium]
MINFLKKRWRWLLLAIICVYIAYDAFRRYIDFDRSNFLSIFDGRFDVGSLSLFILYVHIFTSVLALAVGPFQFWNWLLVKHKNIHRWLGRTYFYLGIFPGAIAGFIVALGTNAGLTGVFGFSLLAIMWAITGVIALVAIRYGDVLAHKRWMYRNFALTFAAVTLRLWLPALIVGQIFIGNVPEEEALIAAYQTIPWLCWVPNMIIVEWIINRTIPAGSRRNNGSGTAVAVAT